MVQDRAMVGIVSILPMAAQSNGAIFSDLERPETHI